MPERDRVERAGIEGYAHRAAPLLQSKRTQQYCAGECKG